MSPRKARGDGREAATAGRLRERPATASGSGPVGLHPLGLEPGRDGLLYVPDGYRPGRPAPMALALHGAGGSAAQAIGPLRGPADSAGMIVLAPESREGTWDVIVDDFGPDVAFLDRALAQTFGRYDVDPGRVAVEGFSDGASYALTLGLANGDLFTHVLAFSPGFMLPPALRGQPRVYVAHGTGDAVLPIDRCSRRLVPRLEAAGYEVHYREFDGPHVVPPPLAAEAVEWFASATPGGPRGR